MDNDSYMFYGGGGFGGVNKAKEVRTVYVQMAHPRLETETATSSTNEPVYKDQKPKRKQVKKRKAKRAKKQKIQKYSNFWNADREPLHKY